MVENANPRPKQFSNNTYVLNTHCPTFHQVRLSIIERSPLHPDLGVCDYFSQEPN